MPDVQYLLSQYPILTSLASQISTLDLYHLASTSRICHARILSSRRIFDTLKRTCLCDGHGLRDRLNFAGFYHIWQGGKYINHDEPIEVRLYNTTCDEAGALPCRKCGINVCEECRYYSREETKQGHPSRRPHLNGSWQLWNVMCLCPTCDTRLENELRGHFLNELCDCEIFTRWICHKCKHQEVEFTRKYYHERTILDYDEWTEAGPTKMMPDHHQELGLYCLCGAAVPEETRPRCTWCARRHLPEDDWLKEYRQIGSRMPFFEDDPCYPPFIDDLKSRSCVKPYPKLKYNGPIYRVPE